MIICIRTITLPLVLVLGTRASRRFERALPATALASYPGSGNTWARALLEAATGVLTGSAYVGRSYRGLPRRGRDRARARRQDALAVGRRRRPRERDARRPRRRGRFRPRARARAPPLRRDPSLFAYQHTRAHGDGRPSARGARGATATRWREAARWRRFVRFWRRRFARARPTLVLRYETLRDDPVAELSRALRFPRPALDDAAAARRGRRGRRSGGRRAAGGKRSGTRRSHRATAFDPEQLSQMGALPRASSRSAGTTRTREHAPEARRPSGRRRRPPTTTTTTTTGAGRPRSSGRAAVAGAGRRRRRSRAELAPIAFCGPSYRRARARSRARGAGRAAVARRPRRGARALHAVADGCDAAQCRGAPAPRACSSRSAAHRVCGQGSGGGRAWIRRARRREPRAGGRRRSRTTARADSRRARDSVPVVLVGSAGGDALPARPPLAVRVGLGPSRPRRAGAGVTDREKVDAAASPTRAAARRPRRPRRSPSPRRRVRSARPAFVGYFQFIGQTANRAKALAVALLLARRYGRTLVLRDDERLACFDVAATAAALGVRLARRADALAAAPALATTTQLYLQLGARVIGGPYGTRQRCGHAHRALARAARPAAAGGDRRGARGDRLVHFGGRSPIAVRRGRDGRGGRRAPASRAAAGRCVGVARRGAPRRGRRRISPAAGQRQRNRRAVQHARWRRGDFSTAMCDVSLADDPSGRRARSAMSTAGGPRVFGGAAARWRAARPARRGHGDDATQAGVPARAAVDAVALDGATLALRFYATRDERHSRRRARGAARVRTRRAPGERSSAKRMHGSGGARSGAASFKLVVTSVTFGGVGEVGKWDRVCSDLKMEQSAASADRKRVK